MSRSDSYRRGRNRGWNRDKNSERSEKNARNDRPERNERNERSERGRGERRFEQNRHFAPSVSQKEIQERENAIRAFKEKSQICEICGQPITDVANAICNHGSDSPVHFDCVLKKITEDEKPGMNEKVAYIGQGRFAVLHFDNPHDQKHFSIRKIIEWEDREQKRGEWRNEMAFLYSQVK